MDTVRRTRDPYVLSRKPVFVRECLVYLRRLAFPVQLTVVVLLLSIAAGLAIPWLLGMLGLTSEHAYLLGPYFVVVLIGSQLIAAVLWGGLLGASSVTAEKRGDTLELLLLTHMSPAKILLQKWMACTAVAGLFVVATTPLLSISFLLGGVSPLWLLGGYALLLFSLGTIVLLSVALSALCRNTIHAIIGTCAACAAVVYYVVSTYQSIHWQIVQMGTGGPFRRDLLGMLGDTAGWVFLLFFLLALLFLAGANRLRRVEDEKRVPFRSRQ